MNETVTGPVLEEFEIVSYQRRCGKTCGLAVQNATGAVLSCLFGWDDDAVPGTLCPRRGRLKMVHVK